VRGKIEKLTRQKKRNPANPAGFFRGYMKRAQGGKARSGLVKELIARQRINHAGEEENQKHCLFEDHIGTPQFVSKYDFARTAPNPFSVFLQTSGSVVMNQCQIVSM
jgi:hypothetical protein